MIKRNKLLTVVINLSTRDIQEFVYSLRFFIRLEKIYQSLFTSGIDQSNRDSHLVHYSLWYSRKLKPTKLAIEQ